MQYPHAITREEKKAARKAYNEAKKQYLKEKVIELKSKKKRGAERVARFEKKVGGVMDKIQKAVAAKAKQRKREFLREELIRRKLLAQQINRRPVNIMANIEDKIPNTFTGEPQKHKMRWL